MTSARELVAEAFLLPVEQVPMEAGLNNFEPWDSLGHVTILLKVEQVIGREIAAEEALSIVDLVSIQELLNGSSRV